MSRAVDQQWRRNCLAADEDQANIGWVGIHCNEATAPLTAEARVGLEETPGEANRGGDHTGEPECSQRGLRQIGHGPIRGSLP